MSKNGGSLGLGLLISSSPVLPPLVAADTHCDFRLLVFMVAWNWEGWNGNRSITPQSLMFLLKFSQIT